MCIIMERTCDNQESDFPAVYQVNGEPAIIINGLPNTNPGGTRVLHLGTTISTEPNNDLCFGELLVGRKIRKLFGDQYYSGEVEKYDNETKWYRVVYEDGDFEDLEWHELEEVLVPLDISIPLKSLASDRYQLERLTSQSLTKRPNVRTKDRNSLEIVEETPMLLQISQVAEPSDGKLIEANFGGVTHLDTLQLQNKLQIENRESYSQACKDDELNFKPTGSNTCNGQDWESTDVFEVIGEPAIVINGVPDVTPGRPKFIHMDTEDISDESDDPCFGEWIVGRKIQIFFGDQYYSGKVEKYNSETKWYRVVYEDGDFEDLEWHELHDLLVPLDISIPITTLALDRFKPEKFISESMAKERKNRTGSIRRTKKTSDALLTSQVGELMDGKRKLMEVNFIESSQQGTSLMQIENIEPRLEMCMHEESLFKLGEEAVTSKDNQRAERAIIQIEAHSETSLQESLKGQRAFRKQSWTTARAEKERRREKSMVEHSA